MRESGEAAHGHHHGHDVGERLYIHRHSPIHDLPPHLKIVSLLTFLIVCVATPIQNYWAFIGFGILIFSLLRIAKLPVLTIAKRATIEIPFLIFAFLMPFFSSGERFELLGIEMSRPGAIAAASIITKGTLGVLTAILLSGSTPAREILRGFELLKMPSLLVQIMTFMLRYMNVITDEMERMKVARLSRGFEERGIRDWKFIAGTAGALFVRSYERGERVHTSMIARGYEGELPKTEQPTVSRTMKTLAFTIPTLALAISTISGAMQ
jgi:cobalt/nickel transport system permease protein